MSKQPRRFRSIASLCALTCLLLACGLLVSCGSYFPPNRHVAREIAPDEVVGRWVMADESVALFRKYGFEREGDEPSTITFNDDGTLRFDSVWEGVFEIQRIEGPGKWTPGYADGRNTLDIEVTAEDARYGFYLNFAEEDGQLILWQYLGDPDLWKFVEYARVDDAD